MTSLAVTSFHCFDMHSSHLVFAASKWVVLVCYPEIWICQIQQWDWLQKHYATFPPEGWCTHLQCVSLPVLRCCSAGNLSLKCIQYELQVHSTSSHWCSQWLSEQCNNPRKPRFLHIDDSVRLVILIFHITAFLLAMWLTLSDSPFTHRYIFAVCIIQCGPLIT